MMFNIFITAFFMIFLLTGASAPLWAQEVPANIDFKTLNTAHFTIIFDPQQQNIAEVYARKLETSYNYLAGYLTARPEKTIVIINDKTDLANGYATRVPYPHIMVYPVLPGPGDSLSEGGDWPLELLSHEYTHILSFEPIGSNLAFLRTLFGSIIAPNLLLPGWWKEGVAVHVESAIGKHGRLKSIYQDAAIRAMVADNVFLTVDLSQTNEPLPMWPEGMRPYLFGSLLWSQMVADHGPQTMEYLFQRHGERVPYAVNTPATEIFGHGYKAEFKKMQKDVQERAKMQLEKLNTTEFTPQKEIPLKLKYTSIPSMSPDGKTLAIVAVDENKKRKIRFLLRQESPDGDKNKDTFIDLGSTVNGKVESDAKTKTIDGPPAGTIQKVSWFHQRQAIIHDRVDSFDRLSKVSDLYIYDLVTRLSQPLSHGLRGREPSLSLDDKKVAFIKLDGGKTSLALFDLATSQFKILYSAPLFDRISSPLFWDEKNIIYSHRDQNGDELLYKFNIETNERTVLFKDSINPKIVQAHHPQKTADGLLFVAGSNGTYNLYLSNKDLTTARPITHTSTAFISATMDPLNQSVFATAMTSQGPRVFQILKDDWQKTPTALPQIEPLLEDRYPASETLKIEDSKPEMTMSDYHSGSYLIPHYWIPFIGASTQSNGLLISAQTSSFDPLKKHIYDAAISYDTASGYTDFAANYRNNVTQLPFALGAAKIRTISPLGVLSATTTGYSAGLFPDVFWLSPNLNFSVGWDQTELETPNITTKSTGPSASLLYSDYDKAGEQISPEYGFGYYLGHTEYLSTPNYFAFSKSKASGVYYFSKWLPHHHVLMMKGSALYIPQTVSVFQGAGTTTFFPQSDSAAPSFVMRGYHVSHFLAKQIYTINTEYRFPLLNLYRGEGTTPLFFHRLSGAVVTDASMLDGFAFNDLTLGYDRIRPGRVYVSSGVELKLETTLGYLLPLTWILGGYSAFGIEGGTKTQFLISVQMGAL